MYKLLKADKDAYVTNKIIRSHRMTGSNVGAAGTLDLFKLYGASYSGSVPNVELSRLLMHFDLSSLKSLVATGKLDVNDPSFWCKIHLKDVYGGQPTPSNFTVSVFPLSASFEEGIGKDVSYYSDRDACNWDYSAAGSQWFVTGCGLACGPSGPGDYMTSSVSIVDTEASQLFKTGAEDLLVDVTSVVSATLAGEIPDSGFRITLTNSLEVDSRTYFVKRFASKDAYDESKRPRMIVGFDDSVSDDTQNLTFDTPCTLMLYNTAGGNLTDIVSGSSLTQITGPDCLLLKLSTEVSGGRYDLVFTGSQHTLGSSGVNLVSGTYSAVVTMPSSDPVIQAKMAVSSSVKFTPIWSSLDGTIAYVSGSTVTAQPQLRSSTKQLNNYVVSVLGLRDSYEWGAEAYVRVHIFDYTSPLISVTRLPVGLPGIVLKNVYYQVRDTATGEVVIPFDEATNSTKVSSDASGMFFMLDTSSLTRGRTYVVDILVSRDGVRTRYTDVSPVFRVDGDEA